MAGPASKSLPLQSLFDRFIQPYGPSTTQEQAERQLQEVVRRDVEWLLNTRRIPDEVPAHFKEVRKSVYLWGLPDLTSFAVRSRPDRMRLQRLLQEAISTMEPRLTDVRVIVEDSMDQTYAIRFTISATLVAPPCVDKVSFNTVVDLSTGNCRVEGGR